MKTTYYKCYGLNRQDFAIFKKTPHKIYTTKGGSNTILQLYDTINQEWLPYWAPLWSFSEDEEITEEEAFLEIL